LPYIVPFYIALALLEDSGYLPRAAFLMDNLMHKIGLHGKAFIPSNFRVMAAVFQRVLAAELWRLQRERFLVAFRCHA
jgi:ferrous iron transport protein B